MIVVGLTGSFASGKSEAARIFKKLGARVYDADRVARQFVRKGRPAYKAVVKLFGRAYLDKSGELNRAKLAARVFSKPADLKKLNTILHPMVIIESLGLIEKNRAKAGLLVLDVPLLFESKMERLADVVVVVRSSPRTVLKRAADRGIAPTLAKKILKSQWPIAKKAKLADFVVENEGTREDLERAVRQLHKTLSVHIGGR